jgi:serine/threonine protein kinase
MIGTGAFGVVRSTEWNKAPAAVKLMSVGTSNDIALFRKEVALMRYVQHRCFLIISLTNHNTVVSCFSANLTSKITIGYIMPLYHCNLTQFMVQQTHNIHSYSKTIALNITDALHYLHNLNIIHRLEPFTSYTK